MRRFAFFLPCLLTFSTHAQQPAPATTIQAGTQLVVVDVIVQDKKGNPVHGLPKSAFSVTEDKKPQTIKTFDEHHAGPPQQMAQPKLPPGVFTNFHPVSSDSPLNVLLLDTLNTPIQAQAYVREQMKNYIRKAQPGQRIAILGMATHLYFLQGFTTDTEILKKAIASAHNVRQSPLVDTANMDSMDVDVPTVQSADNYSDFAKEETAVRNQVRTQYTLDSLTQLARYLAGFPGRKNLIWFSGSFPVSILPQATDMSDPFTVYADLSEDYREMVNQMTKAQVAVYPVDARGVFGAPMLRADQSGSGGFSTGANLQDQLSSFHTSLGEEHATMMQMAEDTGGKTFMNTNDLATAVKDAIVDGSDYYTLTYTPTNKEPDGLFRTIQIDVEGNYRLRYRRGYYASTTKELKKKEKEKTSPLHTIESSMRRGAPEPTQIYLHLRVTPIGTEPGGSVTSQLAAGNATAPRVKPPYRNYSVSIVADPTQMSARQLPDGRRQMDLEFKTFIYDVDGNLLNSITNQLRGALDPQTYNDLFRTGVLLTQKISAPARGEYYLRTNVHDLNNNALGAVEVPLVYLRNLPAVAEK